MKMINLEKHLMSMIKLYPSKVVLEKSGIYKIWIKIINRYNQIKIKTHNLNHPIIVIHNGFRRRKLYSNYKICSLKDKKLIQINFNKFQKIILYTLGLHLVINF